MIINIDCKECDSIYHIRVKSFKEQEIEVTCPFCGTSENVKVGADDE